MFKFNVNFLSIMEVLTEKYSLALFKEKRFNNSYCEYFYILDNSRVLDESKHFKNN